VIERSAIEAALEKVRPAFDADGFSLQLGTEETAETGTAGQGSTVQVVLEAQPGACADCLVPDDVIVGIIRQAIGEPSSSMTQIELVKKGFEDLPDH
jgi:hypothetical protein